MNMILKALMVSVWFMALTFPLVVLKVDALNNTILFRWETWLPSAWARSCSPFSGAGAWNAKPVGRFPAALRPSPARLRPSGGPSPATPASASSRPDDRHAVHQLHVPDQHHDLGADLHHARPRPEHRGRPRRAARARLRGFLRRGRLHVRPAEHLFRPRLLGRAARGRHHGGPVRPHARLPRPAAQGRLSGHRDPRLRRNHPPRAGKLDKRHQGLLRPVQHQPPIPVRHGNGRDRSDQLHLLHRPRRRGRHHHRRGAPQELAHRPCPPSPA